MHTSYHKGTPLFIKMKDGEIIYGKFMDHKSGKVLLEGGKTIDIKDVRAMSIRKLNLGNEDSTPKNDAKIEWRIKR